MPLTTQHSPLVPLRTFDLFDLRARPGASAAVVSHPFVPPRAVLRDFSARHEKLVACVVSPEHKVWRAARHEVAANTLGRRWGGTEAGGEGGQKAVISCFAHFILIVHKTKFDLLHNVHKFN